ncbi:hypothetical protein BDZ91DRAFT_730655 [Kalaharituber pfeilii]|nr:hypothetical protein BDZ91DRAFT_730655 [Kalaharituber pfeilii]
MVILDGGIVVRTELSNLSYTEGHTNISKIDISLNLQLHKYFPNFILIFSHVQGFPRYSMVLYLLLLAVISSFSSGLCGWFGRSV